MFRWLSWVLGAALVGGCTYAALHLDEWGYDDAFISYRYAENLVLGHGLVFNPGEQPVEGYSNLLYVLLMAAGLAVVPREAIWIFSLVLNVACLCAALAILLRHLRSRHGDAAALLWSTPFALSPTLWFAAWTGLETSLVLLLVVAIWAALTRVDEGTEPRPWLLPGLVTLIVLTRVDGFLVAGLVVAYLGLRAHWRRAVETAAAVAGVMAVQVAFRLHYFGFPLSNTYYAKTGLPLPARIDWARTIFVEDYVELYPLLLLIVLAAGVRLLDVRPLRRVVDFGLFFGAAWIFYWFYVGGDSVPKLRFLLPLIPFALAAGAELFASERVRSTTSGALAWVLVAGLLWLPFTDSRLSPRLTSYDPWRGLGKFLGEHHPDARIAVDAAGKIPYFSQLRTLDMLGLNDLHIARMRPRSAEPGHSKFDPAYVLRQRPDLISAWVVNSDFDLDWGLPARLYTRAGYRLAYLVFMDMRGPPPAEPIVDVRELPAARRQDLLRSGYRYAVLGRPRQASPPRLSQEILGDSDRRGLGPSR